MKRILLPLLIFFSLIGSAQQKELYKLKFFGTVQSDVGFDLATVIRKPDQQTGLYNAEDQSSMHFSYGFTGQVGYQPVNWLALSGGLRYSYISTKFHNVYWVVQPYFFTSDADSKDFNFLTIFFGTQLNTTQGLRNNRFFGMGLGKFDLVGNNLAQKIQLNLDIQQAEKALWFVGFSYGITVFSNKNI